MAGRRRGGGMRRRPRCEAATISRDSNIRLIPMPSARSRVTPVTASAGLTRQASMVGAGRRGSAGGSAAWTGPDRQGLPSWAALLELRRRSRPASFRAAQPGGCRPAEPILCRAGCYRRTARPRRKVAVARQGGRARGSLLERGVPWRGCTGESGETAEEGGEMGPCGGA